MEITKHNFNEELDSILHAIEGATFLSFDTEFTGLSAGQGNQSVPFDTPAERYNKLRRGAGDFLLLQVGLCTFKAHSETQRYEARPYSFYIFPRPLGRHSPDRRFLCQSSSIDFLISHDFDFNKVFKEGIPYLTQTQEMKMKADLEQKHADINNQSFSALFSPDGADKKNTEVPVPEEHKPFVNEICDKVKVYLEGTDDDPLQLPPCNAFLRKLLYQALKSKCPQAHLETKTGDKKERYIQVQKAMDTDGLQRLTLDRQMVEMMELDVQVGFTKVMRAVSESGKLLIGHNMFLDVIHTLSHFFGPLPDQLADFKTMVNSTFPRLLDTKLMANTIPFKVHFLGSSLEELRYTVQQPPFKPAQVDLVEGFEKYLEGGTFHEAGYDAFVTGSAFASMVNFFGGYQNPPSQFVLPSEKCVEPFVNKIFLMRIADIPYLNLTGADVEANRDHVFHLTFPVEWKATDIHQLFQPYGSVQISWLTDTTALVGILNKDHAKLALTSLQSNSSVFRVKSFAEYSKERAATEAPVPVKSPVPRMTTPIRPISGIKRKSPNTDLGFPVAKLERRSITKDVHPQSPIIEADENSDNAVSPRKENQSKLVDKDRASKNDAKTEPSPGQEKLFEESDQW